MELLIKEHTSSSYAPRTYYNAKSSDLTIAFAIDMTTAGEKLTKKAAAEKYIGFELKENSNSIKIAEEIITRIKKNNIKTLNIAGNGIYTFSKYGYNQNFINQYIYAILKLVSENCKINEIYTGGQTGVDIAGAVAGYCLGIKTTVTLPNGYKQRFENGIDINNTKEDIENQVKNYSKVLKGEISSNTMRLK